MILFCATLRIIINNEIELNWIINMKSWEEFYIRRRILFSSNEQDRASWTEQQAEKRREEKQANERTNERTGRQTLCLFVRLFGELAQENSIGLQFSLSLSLSHTACLTALPLMCLLRLRPIKSSSSRRRGRRWSTGNSLNKFNRMAILLFLLSLSNTQASKLRCCRSLTQINSLSLFPSLWQRRRRRRWQRCRSRMHQKAPTSASQAASAHALKLCERDSIFLLCAPLAYSVPLLLP